MIEQFIPSHQTILIWAPGAAIILWSASFIAAGCWKRGIRTPYTRKIFHFIIFTSAAIIQFNAGASATVVYGSVVFLGVVHAVMRSDGYPFYEALARPTDRPKRSLHVIVPLLSTAGGGLAANIIAGPLAPIGYLVGGWGDAVGEPVGTRWGRHRFQVPTLAGVRSTRSLEGSGAVFVMSFFAAWFGLVLLGQESVIARAFVTASVVVVIEAVSPHGLDNLLVQAGGAAACLWN